MHILRFFLIIILLEGLFNQLQLVKATPNVLKSPIVVSAEMPENLVCSLATARTVSFIDGGFSKLCA